MSECPGGKHPFVVSHVPLQVWREVTEPIDGRSQECLIAEWRRDERLDTLD
jgi:hypothetical protein